MPQKKEPPSSETASPVTVRRAVSVPGPAQDPGAALGPRVPAPAAPEPAAAAPAPASVTVTPAPTTSAPDAAPEAEPRSAPASTSAPVRRRFGRPRPAEQARRPEAKPSTDPEVKPSTDPEVKSATRSTAGPEVSSQAKPETEPEAKPETDPEVKSATRSTAGPEVSSQAKPEAKPETEPETEPDAKRKAVPTAASQPQPKPEARATAAPEAASTVVVAAGAAGAAAAVDAAGAPGPADRHPARPRGPLLAAAGIAGALLISVPFLVLAAMGDDDSRSVATAPVGGTTLDPGASSDELLTDYAAESPSPSPSGSKASAAVTSPSPTAEVKAAPRAAAEKTEDEETQEPAAEKTTAAARAKKKAATEEAAEPTARERANAASSQSAVLLKNTATGKCADLPAYGKGSVDGPVTQYICRDGDTDNQQWNMIVTSATGGPDGASLFVVKNVKDGLCFDLPYYGSVSKGTPVTEYHCDTTRADNQLWYLEPRAGGTYALRNLASDLCLGVNGGQSAGDDAKLQVMTCEENQYTAQRWIFT